MVAPERPLIASVHVTELAAVALVEDQHHVFAEDLVVPVALHEDRKLLDRRDDDPRARILQLALQLRGRGVRVRRPLLEPVVLPHRLVVQILAVNHEQHLVHVRQPACELRGLEARQRLPGPGRVPDVAAGLDLAGQLVVGGGHDPLQDPLGRDDLIRPHHQQLAVHIEHAIPGQDVQQRVLREERLREPDEVLDRPVVRVRPPRCELEAVRRLP